MDELCLSYLYADYTTARRHISRAANGLVTLLVSSHLQPATRARPQSPFGLVSLTACCGSHTDVAQLTKYAVLRSSHYGHSTASLWIESREQSR